MNTTNHMYQIELTMLSILVMAKELLDIYLKSPKDHYKKDIIKSIDLQSGKVIDQGDTTWKKKL